jgi:hypothetical protein
LTHGKYLPVVDIVKQRILALKKITLFERTLFTFASKQTIPKSLKQKCQMKQTGAIREIYEEVAILIYQSDN